MTSDAALPDDAPADDALAGDARPERAAESASEHAAERDMSALRLAADLHRLSQLLSRPFVRRHAEALGVSHAEWRVLVHVVQSPGITASEIGASTGFTAVHVGRAVKALEASGRIHAVRDPLDSRRRRLEPTDSGAAAYSELAPLALRDVQTVMSVLDDAEFTALVDAIDRIMARAEQL